MAKVGKATKSTSKASPKSSPEASTRSAPSTIDEYIASFSPQVQRALQRIRRTIRQAAPDAKEAISYQIPAFKLSRTFIYFAAFKNHIGLYPPVRGDEKLMKAVAPYAGPNGNLQFRLDEPIPFDLIEQIAKLGAKQDRRGSPVKAKTTVDPSRVEVQNVNVPGRTHRVDAAKYKSMRDAILKALPKKAPGLTRAEMFAAVLPHLSKALFPGGAKANWWAKTVQLDLEAKRLVVRQAATSEPDLAMFLRAARDVSIPQIPSDGRERDDHQRP